MDRVAGLEHDARGVLAARSAPWSLERFAPGPRTAPYVDRYWAVGWELAPGVEFAQPVLAHAGVNVVLEGAARATRAAVHGVPTRLQAQVLGGSGWAVAALFRPGAFRALWPEPVCALTDASRPLTALGADADELHLAVAAATSHEQRARLLETWIAARVPEQVPPATALAVRAAEAAAHDRSLTRAAALAERAGVDLRTLQRLFAEHVGLPPKQVLRRYRLLDAAEAAGSGGPVVWDELALALGFSDQAHLVRDFTDAFGVPPARYAADCRARMLAAASGQDQAAPVSAAVLQRGTGPRTV